MPARPRLYLARSVPDAVLRAIESRFDLTAQPTELPPPHHAIVAGVREADAIICTLTERIDEAVLAVAPRLRVIANYAVGYDNVDVTAARTRGIIVTNTPDVLTETTADLAWALLLASARRVVEGDQLVRGGGWNGWEPTQLLGTEVYGKTLGVVGMGRIGQAVARRATGFHMPVLYHSRHPLDQGTGPPSWQSVSFQALLRQADFVSLHVPLTTETRHLIGAAQLRLMRPTAFLINTARGPIVDEAALIEALAQGTIAGAGLDVYEAEPRLHRGLVGLRNVVLLPHLGSATHETRIRMGLLCVENVRAVLEGRPPLNPVG